jgi:hypothetical protein
MLQGKNIWTRIRLHHGGTCHKTKKERKILLATKAILY